MTRIPADDIGRGICDTCLLPSECCTECNLGRDDDGNMWDDEPDAMWDDFLVGLGESPTYEPGG